MAGSQERSAEDSAYLTRRTTGAGTYQQVLRESELSHTQRFVPLVLVMAVVIAALLFWMGGHPTAQAVAYGGILTATFGVFVLYWLSLEPERYTEGKVSAAYLACVLGVFSVVYYWGMFSAAAAVVTMGVFFVGVGRSLRLALICYAVSAVIQGAAGALIITGAIPDFGLIRADEISTREQVITQVALQAAYLVTLLIARAVRTQLDRAVEHHDRAIRAIARREALLEEARMELQNALKIGGPGRYTEQTLGSFTLGSLIGRGAMGEVYEAVHRETGEPAAVKVLGLSSLGDPQHLARFHREARAAASMRSPHVVSIFEVGDESSPIPYLAMERLQGRDLGHYLRQKRRLDRDWVVELVRQTARGLEAAREAGIVHRDVKPQNLFRARQGEGASVWKILDFGVSKVGDHQGTLTQGGILGTPMYMAPEQARGSEVDHRADLYALAAVGYRALTGRPPFSARDVPSILHQVVYEIPERPSAAYRLPADVDRALAIGMAKRPEDRFASGGELADALERALDEDLPDELRRRGDALLMLG